MYLNIISFFFRNHMCIHTNIYIYAHVQDISFASFLGKCNKIQWTTQLEISAVKKSGDFPLDSRSTVKTRNFIWLGVWDCLGVANHGDVQNMLPQIQISIISFSISLDSQYFLFPSQWSFCIILYHFVTMTHPGCWEKNITLCWDPCWRWVTCSSCFHQDYRPAIHGQLLTSSIAHTIFRINTTQITQI